MYNFETFREILYVFTFPKNHYFTQTRTPLENDVGTANNCVKKPRFFREIESIKTVAIVSLALRSQVPDIAGLLKIDWFVDKTLPKWIKNFGSVLTDNS